MCMHPNRLYYIVQCIGVIGGREEQLGTPSIRATPKTAVLHSPRQLPAPTRRYELIKSLILHGNSADPGSSHQSCMP